jgi:hypothetical protein
LLARDTPYCEAGLTVLNTLPRKRAALQQFCNGLSGQIFHDNTALAYPFNQLGGLVGGVSSC